MSGMALIYIASILQVKYMPFIDHFMNMLEFASIMTSAITFFLGSVCHNFIVTPLIKHDCYTIHISVLIFVCIVT